MPQPDRPPLTRGVVVRGGGFALAIALGAVAVWLIVTSTTQKRLELGVLAGLWGLLLGAFCMFGARRHATEVSGQLVVQGTGTEVELRSQATEVERSAEVAARRAHEARIEQLLRQEIHNAVTREVGTLRSEVAQLRTELLEKVGGQLRLERIETTRVIGSDLEALQDEVRALKAVARDSDFGSGLLRDLGRARVAAAEPARPVVAPQHQPTRLVEASVVETATIDGRTTSTRSSFADARPTPAELTGPIAPQPGPVQPSAPQPVARPGNRASSASGGPSASGGAGRTGAPSEASAPAAAASAPAAAASAQSATPPSRPAQNRPAQVPTAQPPAVHTPPVHTPPVQTLPAQPPAVHTPPVQTPPVQTPPAQTPPAQPRPVQPAAAAERRPAEQRPAERSRPTDPFADLPRLTPFVDDAPEPPRPATPPNPPARPAAAAARTNGHAPATGAAPAPNGSAPASNGVVAGRPETDNQSDTRGPGYEGRRRRHDRETASPQAAATRPAQPGRTAPVQSGPTPPVRSEQAPPVQSDRAPTAQSDRAPTAQSDRAPIAQSDRAPIAQSDRAPIAQRPATPAGPPETPPQAAQTDRGGRRRRADDQPDDLLTRLLAREHH